MVVFLNRIGGGTADRVWYDELEIYKLDDLFEAPETFNAMMKALRFQNKARNGDFKTSASAGKIVPVRNFPSYWHVSGKQAVPGVCAIDGTDGFKSSQSAKLTGMKKPTSVCQYISVKPGEKYRLSIYAKKCGKGGRDAFQSKVSDGLFGCRNSFFLARYCTSRKPDYRTGNASSVAALCGN